jgi:hypothetical protein
MATAEHATTPDEIEGANLKIEEAKPGIFKRIWAGFCLQNF